MRSGGSVTRKPRPFILGPDDPRNPARRTKHGVTADEVDEQLIRQGGACPICLHADRQPLQLDHDHKHCPGREGCRICVRGLICGRCNRAIWGLGDDVATVERLLIYLQPKG